MTERGAVIEADASGGSIQTPAGSRVVYSAGAILGLPPLAADPVCFERKSGQPDEAEWVRFGSCTNAAIANVLEASFHSNLISDAITDDGRLEVSRIASDRAARVLRPIADQPAPPDAVKDARLALAKAAMELMAVEAGSQGTVTAKSLRDVLRGQRPKLPRG